MLPGHAKNVPAAVAAAGVDTVAAVATVTEPLFLVGPGRAVPAFFDASLFDWSVRCCPLKGNRSQPIAPMKEMPVEIEGVVHTVLPGTMFRVELDNKHLVLATISGKMRKRWVRLTVGDRVKMEMSPYDLEKARIVWRLK